MAEKNQYDLAVAYRIYPKVSKIPPIYPDDKFKLSEICLKSFKYSIGSLKVKMFVLLDSCPDEYSELFRKYFEEDDLELIHLDHAGNGETFRLQIELLLSQNNSEIIYLAEDDYLYLPGQFYELIDFLQKQNNHCFVSPYNHPDYYTMNIHEYRFDEIGYEHRNWRTAGSTCLTFLTSRSALLKTKDVFLTYSKKNYDTSIWFCLTKKKIFSLVWFSQKWFFKMLIKSWMYCWKQILFGERWDLWIPVPTIATHMDNKYLPAEIDWNQVFYELTEK